MNTSERMGGYGTPLDCYMNLFNETLFSNLLVELNVLLLEHQPLLNSC